MSHETRQDYYWRRAREARNLAAHATDDRVRLAHAEMATRYEQRASASVPESAGAVVAVVSGE